MRNFNIDTLEILYEDNHVIAVNKRIGEIVQGDRTGDITLPEIVKKYIKKKYHKQSNVFLGVTHRTDRPVSGVVVFARTSKALERINEMFRNKMVEKIYWAIVKNSPPDESNTLVHYIVRNTKLNKSFAYNTEIVNSQFAKLSYKVLSKSDNYYLLEVNLETGRHHQIRAQLAAIGCPIKGDLKYGAPRSNKDGGISLHAKRITFLHPIKKIPITIEAPVPSDNLWNALTRDF